MNDASLLAAYNSQARSVRSLTAMTVVRGRAKEEYRVTRKQGRELLALLDFERPDFIRIKGFLPFVGSRGFEMTSDGHEFRLLLPPDKGKTTLLVGPVDAAAQSPDPRENLRPEPLIAALRWQEGTLRRTARPQPVAAADSRTIEIDLPPARGGTRTARLEFDLRSGVANSLATYDHDGRKLSEAKYSDWREVAGQSAEQPAACFPRRIQLLQPADGYEIDLKILQIALNPAIPRSNFRLSPPRGVSVVHLDMAGGRSEH